MRSSIPSYSSFIALLHSLPETIYKCKGSRTKRAIAKVPLTSYWGTKHDDSFETTKQQLARSTKLSHSKNGHKLSLFTDASETHCSAIPTQVLDGQLKRCIEDQEHEPFSFLSGSFTGAVAGWSVPDEEGFAMVESMTNLDYLVTGRTVAIFTDHANLVYLFDPYGQSFGMSKHTASKLMRWALTLRGFRYVVEHLAGKRNVWADMLSRWDVQPSRKLCAVKITSLLLSTITLSLDARLDWPIREDIRESQSPATQKPPGRFKDRDGIIKDVKGVLWVPKQDKLMQLRIMVAGHAGLRGHRGYRMTQTTIAAHFWWDSVTSDVEGFVKSCLHCLATEIGETVPRPLGRCMLTALTKCYISTTAT